MLLLSGVFAIRRVPSPYLAILAVLLAGSIAGCDREKQSGGQAAEGQANISPGQAKDGGVGHFQHQLDRSQKGTSAPTVAFRGPDDAPVTLAAFRGKPLLVNLWATWCAPCRAEMPALDALQKARGGDDFEVVAVNIDTGDDTKPKKFLSETGIDTLGYYRDNTLELFNDLKKRGLALGLPVTLLIDGDGCLLAHMNGPADWAGDDARRLVETARNGG